MDYQFQTASRPPPLRKHRRRVSVGDVATVMRLGSRDPSEFFSQIRHRNAVTEIAWEDAVEGLGMAMSIFQFLRLSTKFLAVLRLSVNPIETSLRSCPLPIIPLSLSREEGMIHFFVGSQVKKPESGLFSERIGNNTDDLRCSNWPKCRHPLVVVDFSLHFCLRHEQ